MSKVNSSSNNNDGPVEFLAEMLEKLVDAQLTQTDKISSMKENISVSREDLNYIKSQFTNGFRSEIKNHITSTIKDQNDKEIKGLEAKMDKLIQRVDEGHRKIDVFRRPRFWIKILASLLVAIATITYTTSTILSGVQDRERVKYLQNGAGVNNDDKNPRSRPG